METYRPEPINRRKKTADEQVLLYCLTTANNETSGKSAQDRSGSQCGRREDDDLETP